jgi:predicted secreted acid phosphatase
MKGGEIVTNRDVSAIWLPKSTIEKLKRAGLKGETYNDIILRLLETNDRKRRVVEKKEVREKPIESVELLSDIT